MNYLIKIFIVIFISCIFLGCTSTPKYLSPTFSEVEQPPTLLVNIEPDYPNKARESGLEGSVELFLLISDRGEVKKTRISNSSGYKILDDAAIKYSRQLKFSPANENGKPVSLWISWVINYQLDSAEPDFDPNEYIKTIANFYKQAERDTGKDQLKILQKIINAHESYIQYQTKNPKKNLSKYIKKVVTNEVADQWQDFWRDWPLRFIVFHDFILRFPNSEKINYATDRLLKLIYQDIVRIRNVEQNNKLTKQKKDKFLKIIYSFLQKHYPHSITDNFRTEADKYFKKN